MASRFAVAASALAIVAVAALLWFLLFVGPQVGKATRSNTDASLAGAKDASLAGAKGATSRRPGRRQSGQEFAGALEDGRGSEDDGRGSEDDQGGEDGRGSEDDGQGSEDEDDEGSEGRGAQAGGDAYSYSATYSASPRHRLRQTAWRSSYLFRVPVHFKDGVPMVSVRIDGQPAEFVGVADTGSHYLNLAADTCKSCDGKFGSFVTTPQLQRQLHAQPTVWLRYGTQHDAAKVIKGAGVQLDAGGKSLRADVHVTMDRVMAASNFNVVGLLRRVGRRSHEMERAEQGADADEGAHPEFLSQILPPTSALYIRFYGNQVAHLTNRGFVAGVPRDVVQNLRRNATVSTRLLPSLATVGSYVVHLTAVRVGGRAVEGAPKFLLIDTGSNMTSFPRQAFADMLPALLRGAALTLEIDHQPVDISAATYTYVGAEQGAEKGAERGAEKGAEKGAEQGTEQGFGVFRPHGPDPVERRLMIDDDLRILDDAPTYAIWGAHAMRGHNLVFTGDDHLLLTPAAPDPTSGLVPDDALLS